MEDGENNGVGDSNHKDIINTPAAAPSLAEEVLISSLVQGESTVSMICTPSSLLLSMIHLGFGSFAGGNSEEEIWWSNAQETATHF
jgi:hypothetical protein